MKKYIILLLFLILICCCKNKSPFNPATKGPDRFLLTEAEMNGYDLKDKDETLWEIDKDFNTLYAARQTWHKIGMNDGEDIYIDYCEFDTEVEAIQGTAYAATRSNSWPYIWGSLNGSIINDGSWIVAIGEGAIYFVTGNIGISIFKPVRFNEKDRQLMLSLCSKLQRKIKLKLTNEIIFIEEDTKSGLIQQTNYQVLTFKAVLFQLMNGYSLHSTYDSKWLIDSTTITTGIRKEWKNTQGAIVGIDICKFNSDSQAITASKLMSKNTWRVDRLFQLDDLDALQQIINKWEYIGPGNNITVVAYKKNIAYHVYYYNPAGINKQFFYTVFEKLSKRK